MNEIIFLGLVFVVAALYASVGHGGASGYLALMVLFGIDVTVMKGSALVLNVFVAGISWFTLFRSGFFKIRLALPFCLTSVPMAFAGARIQINTDSYKFILGILLLLAVLNLLLRKKDFKAANEVNFYLALLIGGTIGFLSGMIGIGGGIILSPLILLFRWATLKETAAVSAFFILLNSLSGIAGMINKFPPVDNLLVLMLIFAFTGGIVGSWYTKEQATNVTLKYLLSGVLLFAAFKLLVVL